MSVSDLLQKIEVIGQAAAAELRQANSPESLQDIKAKYLGKKGALSEVLKGLKNVADVDRPRIGAAANQVRDDLENIFHSVADSLEEKRINAILGGERIDITLPGRKRRLGAIHPLTQVRDQLCAIFRKLGFAIATGPEVETEYCNFEALNVPANHPARDMQDTLYLRPGIVLRTHTSSMQIRAMLKQTPPIKVVAAGAVYRNDAVDATHSPMFHQIEALYVDTNVTMADLKGSLEFFAHELFGAQTKIRFRPSFFPFTEPSVEVDFSCVFCASKGCRICKQTGWIEILGAGMVNPAVFEHVGYDLEKYTGFAFGIGIERVAMLFYDVDDIRLFYENDVRFLEQFSQ